MGLSLPNLSARVLDPQSGTFTNAWTQFFTALVGGKGVAIEMVTPTASPFAYTASRDGVLSLTGGAGLSATLTRARMTVPVAVGSVPMAQGDVVSVTYTTAPVMVFIPR